MHRKDMEALLTGTYTVAANTKNAETREWVESIQAALTELLDQSRWRKMEEEPPGKPDLYAVFFPNNGHRYAWWVDGGFEIDGKKVNPILWLPIPEVSE